MDLLLKPNVSFYRWGVGDNSEKTNNLFKVIQQACT